MITDRDICVALGTRDRLPSTFTASQVMSRNVATCRDTNEIHEALRIMRTRKVRRIPVVDHSGKLECFLCLSDLVLDARHDDGSKPLMELTSGDYAGRRVVSSRQLRARSTISREASVNAMTPTAARLSPRWLQ